MKKLISLLFLSVMLLSLAACGSKEVEVSKTAFPEIVGSDMEGNPITSDIFKDYDATIVNFWNNGCGSCIEEMPELEEYYQEFKDKNINLIGVGTDSCENKEKLDLAKRILPEKGVTYTNIIPDMDSDFYKTFIADITSYPTTYVVDRDGNIIGSDIVGVIKNQEQLLKNRIELATE